MLKIKTTFSELLFIIMLFGYTFIENLGHTEWYSPQLIIVQRGFLLFAALKLMFDKRMKTKHIVAWIVIAVICLGMVYTTASLKLLAFLILLFSASNMNKEAIIKTTFISMLIVWGSTVCGALLGVLPMEFLQQGERVRYYLGFTYVTFGANMFMSLVLFWLYLVNRRPNWKESLVVLVLNQAVYDYTDTKMIYFCVWALIIMINIKQFADLKYKWFRVVLGYAFVLGALLSMLPQIFYDSNNNLMVFINQLTNGRLHLGHTAFLQDGISILGQVVDWSSFQGESSSYLYVDSSYLNIAIKYGIIFLALLIGGFTIVMKNEIKRGNGYRCLVFLFLAVHAMTDPHLFSINYNPFVFLLSHMITTATSKRKLEMSL